MTRAFFFRPREGAKTIAGEMITQRLRKDYGEKISAQSPRNLCMKTEMPGEGLDHAEKGFT